MIEPTVTDSTGHLTGCLIVSGLPGAGKTTITRAVASSLPCAARLDGDDVNVMIVSGRVGPVSEPAHEAERQLRLRAQNLCSLANNFAEAGFTPIIDHVVPDRAVLDFMVTNLVPRPVMFVVLAPSLDVCRQRNSGRSVEDQVFYDYSELSDEMSRELKDVGWWFDTAAISAEATAAEVIAHAHSAAVVG